MNYTDLSICSNALLKLGAESITSYADGTAEAEIASSLYPLVRDSLLSSYPWKFAVAQKKLQRLADAPIADYRYAYLLPNNFLRVISAGEGGRGQGIEYAINENRLHTNKSEVVLTYIFRPSESLFPPFFCEALVAKLAAEFCLPLTESTSRAEMLAKISDDLIVKARLIDAQQATPSCFEDYTLVEARK